MAESSLLRASTVGVAARSAALAVTAVTHFWLARELGPSGYGEFVLALVIQGLVALASNLGVSSALAYHVAQDPGRARPILWYGLILSVATVALVLPPTWLVLVASDLSIFPGLEPGWVAAALVTVPLRLFQEHFGAACVGLGLLGRTFAQNAAGPSLLLAALVTARLAGTLDPPTVAAAWLVANVGAVGLAASLTMPTLPRESAPGRTSSLRLAVDLLALGGQQTLNFAAWWSLARGGRAIVGAVAGTEGAGRFGVSASIAEILMYIPSVIQLSLFSRIARAEAGDAATEVQRSTRLAVLIVTVASAVMALAAAWSIEALLGPSYRDAAATFVALIPGVIALTPVTIIGVYFLARLGQPAVNLVPTAVALATLVPAVWLLGQRWGIVGAGLGTSLAYVVAGGVAVALFTRRSKLGWIPTIVPTVSDGRSVLRIVMGRGPTPWS